MKTLKEQLAAWPKKDPEMLLQTTGRVKAFLELQHHPMHGKLYAKLGTREIFICITFIETHSHLDKNEFTKVVNRWFMDSPTKPKHHSEMFGLVSILAAM